MSLSPDTSLTYLVVALPLAAGAAWSMYRYSAPALLELMDDADEMLVTAVHRITTVGHLLFALGIAVAMTPNSRWDTMQGMPAVLGAWAGLLLWLGLIHVGLLGAFALVRYRQRRWEIVDLPPAPRAQAQAQCPPPPALASWPTVPPMPAMPPRPMQPQPAYAAAPFGPLPYGPVPANPWAPPFR